MVMKAGREQKVIDFYFRKWNLNFRFPSGIYIFPNDLVFSRFQLSPVFVNNLKF